MSRLEEELRNAMRREDPGPEFTRKVLARVAAAPAKRSWWEGLTGGFRGPQLRWAAAGVMAGVLLITGGLEYRREQRMRAEGEAAKEQLILAMRIAGSKLHVAQQKVAASRLPGAAEWP
jgi:hypothetical protein